jgi:hypothetical protein
MSPIEVRGIKPEELIRDIENIVQCSKEDKYAFQVGLKDLDFDVDREKLQALDLELPFQGISQAEQALANRAITPTKFFEHDGTEHKLLAFDPHPVGKSGFMDCVTHSLAITDQGIFEVGRYPAMSLSNPGRYWQWFLHRRFATPDEVKAWQKIHQLTPEEIIDRVYSALTGVED